MRQQWCIGVKFEWIHTMYFADVQQAVTTCWRVIFWNFSHIINFVIHFFIPETLECYSCRLHCSWVKSCAVHHIYNLFETSFCSENPQSCPNTKSKGLDSFCPTAQDKVGGGWLTTDQVIRVQPIETHLPAPSYAAPRCQQRGSDLSVFGIRPVDWA